MAKPTLLIVDDEELVRWSLRERFRHDGYTVVEAGTAAAGVEHVTAVDLVLLDYRLPDGDGLTVLRRMKELERENQRLRQAVADLTLDKLILQEAARGNF